MSSDDHDHGPIRHLFDQYRRGEVSRRAFVETAIAAGAGASSVLFLAERGAAQSATPGATPGATPAASPELGPVKRPDSLTQEQSRGEGGTLKIIQYQAPTILSPHVTTGYKDYDAAQLVLEPLMMYLPDAQICPILLTEVPSVEAGSLAEDLTSATLTLLPDLMWSDGEPVTADDIKFTVEWVQDPANSSSNRTTYSSIKAVEVVDAQTAKVTYTGPSPLWYEPFVSYVTGAIYPKHIFEAGEDAAANFALSPIGTGPYKIETFTPNDAITYVMNENYREPNKPFFDRVELKGGGDSTAAARAVLQTGEYDYAWALGSPPDVIASMLSDDGPGVMTEAPGVNVERIVINFSDPNTEVDGQKSEMNTPHPILADPAVRQAMAMAADRQTITDAFYGLGAQVGINVVNGDPLTTSPNTSWAFDLDAAGKMLDDAGWTLNGDVREKDGMQLKLRFASAVSARRQQAQALVKETFGKIGIRVQLESVDSGIFFDSSAGNDQNFQHFYSDIEMYVSPQGSPRPLAYMEQFYAGPDNENIAQKANGWLNSNNSRWANAEFDEIYASAVSELDPDTLAEDFIRMNDLVIMNQVHIPLVLTGAGTAVSRRMNLDNMRSASFSGAYWNIANWNRAE